MCALLENFQTESGLVIPEVLRKYIPNQPAFIPFITREPGTGLVMRASTNNTS